MASACSYSNYYLNINRRKIEVNQSCYDRKIKDLKNKEDNISRINLELIENEYNNYLSYEQFNYSMSKRKIEIGPLLEDSFTYLINNGLVYYDRQWLTVINFAEHLDLALAIAFNLDFAKVHNRLLKIAEEKNITVKELSLVTLESVECGENALTLGELMSIDKEIEKFFVEIITKREEDGISALDLATSYNFSEMLTISEESEIVVAFRLKIFLKLNAVLKKLVVDFYRYNWGNKGIILSQNLRGITLLTTDKVEDNIYIQLGGKEISLPYISVDLNKGC